MTPDTDPTAIPIKFDPRTKRMVGVAFHGDMPFDVPFISHIVDNLWVGGCEDRLILPNTFKHLVSLYPWERYRIKHKMQSESYTYLYDADVPDEDLLTVVVLLATYCVNDAPTLIHCQAGLNRSNLVAALVLREIGYTTDAAIALLREKRSPAVLCNPEFEAYLRGLEE